MEFNNYYYNQEEEARVENDKAAIEYEIEKDGMLYNLGLKDAENGVFNATFCEKEPYIQGYEDYINSLMPADESIF